MATVQDDGSCIAEAGAEAGQGLILVLEKSLSHCWSKFLEANISCFHHKWSCSNWGPRCGKRRWISVLGSCSSAILALVRKKKLQIKSFVTSFFGSGVCSSQSSSSSPFPGWRIFITSSLVSCLPRKSSNCMAHCLTAIDNKINHSFPGFSDVVSYTLLKSMCTLGAQSVPYSCHILMFHFVPRISRISDGIVTSGGVIIPPEVHYAHHILGSFDCLWEGLP